MQIDWNRYFDRIFLIHLESATDRLPRLMSELQRVGITESGILELELTVPTFIEGLYWNIVPDSYKKSSLNPLGALNLTLANERIFRKSLCRGYRNILVLEDDVSFIKDIGFLNRVLEHLPKDYDFVQFDKFVSKEDMVKVRKLPVAEGSDGLYLRLDGMRLPSTVCCGYSAKGMRSAIESLRDGYKNIDCIELCDARKYVASNNVAIQTFYEDNMSNRTVGMKVSHESMYGHQGIKKSDFGVGDPQAVKKNPHKFISVYAIAKNEENHVERWYECMKEADEICVLDTGSTDDTVRLLKERGVNVSVKKYDDFQFDVARNDARKLVSEKADILFAIDLDETIAPGWRKTLERAWTAAEESGSTPSYAEYRFKTNLENGEIAYINKIHSAKDGVWVYGIHEALRFKGKEHICIEDSFCLEHHPDKGKSRGQYLRMLERAVEREPDSARMRLYYGREFANRGKFDDALREFDKCVQLSLRQLGDIDSVQRSVVMYYCAKIYYIKGDVRNAELWCLRSVLQSKRRDNTFLLATIYEKLNDNILANKAYEESVSIKEHNRGYPEDPEAWTAILFGRYAKSLWAVGEYHKSKLMAEEAHRLEPGNKDYLNLVNEINQKMPRTAEK